MTLIEYLSLNRRYFCLNERLDYVKRILLFNKTRMITLEDRIMECIENKSDDEIRISGYKSQIKDLKLESKRYFKSKISLHIRIGLMALFTPLYWKKLVRNV